MFLKKNYLFLTLISCFFLNNLIFSNKCNIPKRYSDIIYEPSEIRVINDITYSYYKDPLTNRSLTLDYYSAVETCADRPFIVMVHGGGFSDGNKYELFKDAIELARRGYAVFTINYRLMGNPLGVIPSIINTTTLCHEGKFNDISWYWAMQDLNAAIKHIAYHKNKYKIDPNNTFIYGGSAGAIATMQLAYASEQEVFNAFPNVNFDSIWFLGGLDKTTHPSFKSQSYKIKGIATAYGAVMRSHFIDKNETVPIIMLHNACDLLVPYNVANNRLGSIFNTPCNATFYGSRFIYDKMEESEKTSPVHKLYVDCANPTKDGKLFNHGILPFNSFPNFLHIKTPEFFNKILKNQNVTNKIDLISNIESYCKRSNSYNCLFSPKELNTEEVSDLNIEFQNSINNILAIHPNNTFEDKKLILSPNPTYKSSIIDFTKWSNQKVEINAFKFNGELLLNHKLLIDENNSNYTLQTSNWLPGVYFIKVNSPTGSELIKLIKK